MDSLATGTIGGVTMVTILGIAISIYKIVNHTACRSRCCGHQISASIDVGASPYGTAGESPLKEHLVITIPGEEAATEKSTGK